MDEKVNDTSLADGGNNGTNRRPKPGDPGYPHSDQGPCPKCLLTAARREETMRAMRELHEQDYLSVVNWIRGLPGAKPLAGRLIDLRAAALSMATGPQDAALKAAPGLCDRYREYRDQVASALPLIQLLPAIGPAMATAIKAAMAAMDEVCEIS